MNLYSGLPNNWVVRGALPSTSSNVNVSSCAIRCSSRSCRKHTRARQCKCNATEQPVGVASLSSSVSALDSMQADDLLQEMARAGNTVDAKLQSEALSAMFQEPADGVQRVLLRNPAALKLPLSQLVQSTSSLSAVLGLQPLMALAMVAKAPSLVETPAHEVLQQASDIAALVGLPLEDAAPLIPKQPSLLSMPMDELTPQAKRLSSALEISLPGLLLLLSRLKPAHLKSLMDTPSATLTAQVQSIRRLLARSFGGGRGLDAMLLVARRPALLLAPPEQMAQALARLSTLLKLPAHRLTVAVQQCPGLLCMDAGQLTINYKGALAALRIDVNTVAQMLAEEPRLLQLDPLAFKSRVDGMMSQLYLPRKQVLDMVVREPQLLLYLTPTLKSHWTALKSLLRAPHEVVVVIVQNYPELLTRSPYALKAKLERLQRAFRMPPLRAAELATAYPSVFKFSTEHIQAARDLLVNDLKVSEEKLEAVRHAPTLIMQPTATTRGKLADLCALLDASPATAAAMIRDEPTLITQDSRQWQTNFDTMTSQLGLSITQARAASVMFPELLSRNSKQLWDLCQALARLVSTSPVWASELEHASPSSINRCLSYGPRQLQLLQYCADAGLQAEQPFLGTLLYSTSEFVQRFPGFETWQASSPNRKKRQPLRSKRMRPQRHRELSLSGSISSGSGQ